MFHVNKLQAVQKHSISTFTAIKIKKKKEATISEKRVSFALSGPPEGYSVNSIKEDAL